MDTGYHRVSSLTNCHTERVGRFILVSGFDNNAFTLGGVSGFCTYMVGYDHLRHTSSPENFLVPLDAALHVICRGNNLQKIFHSDNDKLRYYALLKEFKTENRLSVYYYCFMDSHIHLILRLNTESKLSKFMKQVNLTYFHYYKKLYGYFGHFWQDRFRSNVIEVDSYLLQCGKYIELNPVRAGMVIHPEEYPFSSYNFYAKAKPDTLITPSPAYLGLSDSGESRQKLYIDFVINSDIINSSMLEKKIYIGSQVFISKMQEYYQIKNRRARSGRPAKA